MHRNLKSLKKSEIIVKILPFLQLTSQTMKFLSIPQMEIKKKFKLTKKKRKMNGNLIKT